MALDTYLAFIAASLVIALIPGPTVTLIVANGLTHGTRAALLNVAGTQFGVAAMLVVVAIGLTSVIAFLGAWFDWLRIAGALYLAWLGLKLWRSNGDVAALAAPQPPRGGFLLQGILVALGNPKMLLFFGAFIPQFVDPAGDQMRQVVTLGLTAMATAAVSDAAYALLAGRTRTFLSAARARLMARIGGAFLIGGGLWLALARTR